MPGCQVVWARTHLPASYGDLAALSQDEVGGASSHVPPSDQPSFRGALEQREWGRGLARAWEALLGSCSFPVSRIWETSVSQLTGSCPEAHLLYQGCLQRGIRGLSL